jgi:hypothetical protein
MQLPQVVAVALVLVGCSGAPAQEARKMTYPPTFQYVARAEIKSDMHLLAASVVELDRELRPESGEPVQAEVVRILEDIDRVVNHLASAGQPTGHVSIDLKLDLFRRDVRAAYETARADPPQYFLAGAVIGSCVYCHR